MLPEIEFHVLYAFTWLLLHVLRMFGITYLGRDFICYECNFCAILDKFLRKPSSSKNFILFCIDLRIPKIMRIAQLTSATNQPANHSCAAFVQCSIEVSFSYIEPFLGMASCFLKKTLKQTNLTNSNVRLPFTRAFVSKQYNLKLQ